MLKYGTSSLPVFDSSYTVVSLYALNTLHLKIINEDLIYVCKQSNQENMWNINRILLLYTSRHKVNTKA